MSTASTTFPIQREPELLGQTVVAIGGSAGIGLETARRARADGAKLILTGRNAERLQRAASEVDALSTAVFDATDPAPLERFFRDLPATIDHVVAPVRAVLVMMCTAKRGDVGRSDDAPDGKRGAKLIAAQCASRSHLGGGVAGDLEHQQEVLVEGAARLREVHVDDAPVVMVTAG